MAAKKKYDRTKQKENIKKGTRNISNNIVPCLCSL